MKRIAIVLCVLLAACFGLAAQGGPKFDTGNASLDKTLVAMDGTAAADQETFRQGLATAFGKSRAQIDDLFADPELRPADAYMCLEIAKATGKPVDEVMKQYRNSHSWGLAAKEAGIQPGSKEFKALKGKAEKYAKKVKAEKAKADKARKAAGGSAGAGAGSRPATGTGAGSGAAGGAGSGTGRK